MSIYTIVYQEFNLNPKASLEHFIQPRKAILIDIKLETVFTHGFSDWYLFALILAHLHPASTAAMADNSFCLHFTVKHCNE